MTQPQAAMVLFGVLVLAVVAMWWGWRRRGQRQAGLPPLPEPPVRPRWSSEPIEGLYVGTTSAGDWLDRMVVHGLGARGRAWMRLAEEGVLVERSGEAALFISSASIRDVRRDRALAGTVVEAGGLVVLSWEHGGHLLDTGFRERHPGEDLYPRLTVLVGAAR